MDLKLKLRKKRKINNELANIMAVLVDTPRTLAHFPKLKPITELAEGRYRWELETIGTAGIEHDVSFATDFDINAETGKIRFTPVKGEGNAQIGGELNTITGKNGCTLELTVEGTIKDIPVPMLLRAPAKPIIKKIFEDLVDGFADQLAATLESEGQ